MSKFLLGIAQLDRDPHRMCFMDHVKSIAGALRSLGHEVSYTPSTVEEVLAECRVGARLIMWGANRLVEDAANNSFMPADTIIFQTEQVSAIDKPEFFVQNWIRLKSMIVWDYSITNVDSLKGLGITSAVHCPLGYHPSMETIKPAYEDIDVLFYGSSGGARRDILNALDETNLNVVRAFNVYGEARDALIARSKVVINLHFYQSGVFEIFRCSHLFANRKCVVNEAGGRDAQLESLAEASTSYVSRDALVDECRRLVGDDKARREQAERGYEAFKKIDMIENVRLALEASKQ